MQLSWQALKVSSEKPLARAMFLINFFRLTWYILKFLANYLTRGIAIVPPMLNVNAPKKLPLKGKNENVVKIKTEL